MYKNLQNFQKDFPETGKDVYIDPSARIIGKVTLENNVSVWPMAVIRGDVHHIHIGEDSNIQDAAVLHVTHDGPFTPGGAPLIIGKGVTVGHGAILHGCQIDDYSLIGMGALILDNVHIEHHVMVAAGTVVTPGKILESGYLYIGNPARAFRQITATEWEQLEYSAAHYVRLKNRYLDD